MANHLIIGLGGTGGKVLREFRKRVYEEFRSNEPTGNVHVEYLYVDSSPADLNDRTGWKSLGKPVHLSESQKVSIHGINASMLENIQMYPGINSFLNSEDINLMTSRLGPLVTAGIGGQRRRLGRTLLANNMSVKDNNNFVQRLGFVVNALTNASGDADVTFHICSGLAGGTGSGSIVDVIAQIRKTFPHVEGSLKYKLLLYLYVPEMNMVYHNHDAGFYQANGYAALSELNAISVGLYNPLDISGQKDNLTNTVQRLLRNQTAFDAAYLYTNINESGRILDITQALPAAVADFLFQKIIAPAYIQTMPSGEETGEMSRLVGCENDGAGPEYDQANKPTRSRKFIGFGIRRVEYPETEIEEYVAYNFAKQATLQLQFNNWQEGIGYGETSIEEVSIGLSSEIEDKKNYPNWLISVSHLTLATPIIDTPQSKKWKDLTQTWELRTQQFADDIQTDSDKKSWLRLFSEECSEYFDRNFRSFGVKKFYELQKQDRIAYARHIRNHIETLLFNEWRSGERSLLNIEAFVRLLISNCENRINRFKERIASKQDDMTKANEAIKSINNEWNNIGWLRDAITGASKKALSSYKTAACDFYTAATMIEAYKFATCLLQALIEQLTQMYNSVGEYRRMLNDILEEVTRQVGSKCRKEDISDEMTLKKYDRDLVDGFTKSCVVDLDTQKSNAGAIRQKLVEMLGEDGERSFSSLLQHADLGTTTDVIIDICQKNADSAMINAAANDSTRKMVGVNILEKIKQEYNTEEKLQAFVRSIVDSATTFLQYNQQQKAMVFSNSGGNMASMIQLCIPEYPDDTSGFRDRLIKTFAEAAPGFQLKQDVSVNPKSNQIVVVAAKAGFPLRYVTNVELLKQKYEDMLHADDKALNRMVLHTESFNEELPPLFEMSTNEVKEMIKAPVLLAYALGIIQQKSDPQTGRKFDALRVKDIVDYKWEELGKDILTVTDSVAKKYALATKLKDEVKEQMKTAARSNEQKDELRVKLVDILNKVILSHPLVGNNEFSPIYQEYRNICGKIFENELKNL